MKDYLNETINFEDIDFVKTMLLVRCIHDTKDPSISRVSQKFSEMSGNFDNVLRLLIQANLVKIENKKLIIITEQNILDRKVFTKILMAALFKSKLYNRSNISEFFKGFILKNNIYWFLPNRKTRLYTSGIRNFLISLGFLRYDLGVDAYFVTDEGMLLIDQGLNKNRLSPLQLSQKLLQIEKIGSMVEKEIFLYEKSRLKKFPALIAGLEHVSLERVNAGYDIKSFSENPDLKNPVSRYIEVKAVSEKDLKFYWSRNEMDMAKTLGDTYYLYLVPVKADSVIDTDNIVIIQNPYKNVFKNNEEWKSEVELTSFEYLYEK